VLIDHGEDLDRAAVGGGVVLEVDRPHHVRRRRGRYWRDGGGPDPLASLPDDDSEALFAPQALDLLVVDHPALAAGVVVGTPMPPAGMLAGVGA
jgi:hypothetical protein